MVQLIYENKEALRELEELINSGKCNELAQANIYNEDILLIIKRNEEDSITYKIITQQGIVITVVHTKEDKCIITYEHILSEDLYRIL